ncbi:carboxypeptidase-like regulatory domain-containing protein [Niastella sp. OAS944]|uniref:carboxypeptidase-like regulatory domain-containing protein n=1 Tax=Niastella sp. OAS944 TaxID=2664089 RepID=UPI00346A9805|nr:hypothetical protein [Chitinophagaceae bacterium OAS944]
MAKGSSKKGSNVSQKAETNSGNVYQANGNIIIKESETKPPDKTKWLSTTQSVVTILGTMVAIIIGVFITISEKLGCNTSKPTIVKNDSIDKKPIILITGIIRDRKTKNGVPNAYITSDINLKDTVITNSDGTFQFEASGNVGQSIRVYVQADSYHSRNEYHSLGLPIDIELDKR